MRRLFIFGGSTVTLGLLFWYFGATAAPTATLAQGVTDTPTPTQTSTPTMTATSGPASHGCWFTST
jgi:hypothetical protein